MNELGNVVVISSTVLDINWVGAGETREGKGKERKRIGIERDSFLDILFNKSRSI